MKTWFFPMVLPDKATRGFHTELTLMIEIITMKGKEDARISISRTRLPGKRNGREAL